MVFGAVLGYLTCLVANDELLRAATAIARVTGLSQSEQASSTDTAQADAEPQFLAPYGWDWEFAQACRPGYPDVLYNKKPAIFTSFHQQMNRPSESPPLGNIRYKPKNRRVTRTESNHPRAPRPTSSLRSTRTGCAASP